MPAIGTMSSRRADPRERQLRDRDAMAVLRAQRAGRPARRCGAGSRARSAASRAADRPPRGPRRSAAAGQQGAASVPYATEPIPSSRTAQHAPRRPRADRVLRLQRGDRMDGVGAAQAVVASTAPGSGPCPPRPAAAYRADRVLDRRARIYAMQIEQVDRLGREPPQARFAGAVDVRRLAAQADQAFCASRSVPNLVATNAQRPAVAGSPCRAAPRCVDPVGVAVSKCVRGRARARDRRRSTRASYRRYPTPDHRRTPTGVGHNEERSARRSATAGRARFVATSSGRCATRRNRLIGLSGKPAYVTAACEASLRRLATETIGLFYLHSRRSEHADRGHGRRDGAAGRGGKVRYLGLSEAHHSLRRAHAVHPIRRAAVGSTRSARATSRPRCCRCAGSSGSASSRTARSAAAC